MAHTINPLLHTLSSLEISDQPLVRSFFEQPTLDATEQLLGKQLIFETNRGIITEAEAYIGRDDPACHAAKGKTKRTSVMFGPAGFSYVYLIYGMYYCLNIVTEAEDYPAAILIRGVYIHAPTEHWLNGPGKCCKALGITTSHNNIDLIKNPSFTITEGIAIPKQEIHTTPRIGISQGLDRLWRYVIA